MLHECIHDDHTAKCALAFQKNKLTALRYHIPTSHTSCLQSSSLFHDAHTNTDSTSSSFTMLTHTRARAMIYLGMYHTLAASRSTHASAHHNNALMGWGYILYRPLGFDSPFPNSTCHKALFGSTFRQWLQN